MSQRDLVVTPLDVELLVAVERSGSVVAAARSIGISRDRAVYRLERLRRRMSGPVVAAQRGGADGGRTGLTRRGRSVVSGGSEAVAWPSPGRPPRHQGFVGTFRRDPEPRVVARDGFAAAVAFAARDGERVAVRIDPESIVVLLHPTRSSARNAWEGTVERVRAPPARDRSGRRELLVRVGPRRLTVALTNESVRALRLVPGRRVTLLAKATAVRRVGATPGSRPG
ncbi:MAG: TOBE domain-containing protein [Thermoplasmata archaeon]|nr:TOBE domain-containing protein [Thermoplasmata archaeon]MCI4356356.1 TOBE domain-containing protein [Thermoplasmata archaeon]